MNEWLEFLAANGARIEASGNARVSGFSGMPEGVPRNYITPLAGLGLIAATGDDAASFLHNQLTNDVEHLGLNESRLAAYCTPKGRMLASFLVWRSPDAIMLQLARELQPAIQKRLQMFVLRAKAKLSDATDQFAVLGLGGEAAASVLASKFPMLPEKPFAAAHGEAGTVIRAADALGSARYQWIAPVPVAIQAWPELTKAMTPVGEAVWQLGEIHAGIAHITQATQEQFVPQMVNYEVIGGVNFKKGCYPGQEIVARSQYLGKLKRRTMLASVAAPDAAAGMEVFSSVDPDQPCGMVVNAVRNGDGGSDCLVEVKVAAAEDGTVHLRSAQGPVLAFGALPYALPA